jgi:hypothetical protein
MYLHRVYEVFSHLSALYASAFLSHKASEDGRYWEELSEQVIADMGRTLTAWHDILNKDIALPDQVTEQNIEKRNKVLVARFTKLHTKLTMWTTPDKWLNIMIHCENCWLRQMRQIYNLGVVRSEKLDIVTRGAQERIKKLKQLRSVVNERESRLTSNYAVPVPLTLTGTD